MADEQKGTEYKVLIPAVETETVTHEGEDVRERVVPGAWREVSGTYTAPNDIAAIKAAANDHGPYPHGAVAVPVRSWRPRTPQVKVQETTLWT